MTPNKWAVTGMHACRGCGTVKDAAIKETYPYPEDHVVDDRPIGPLFRLDAEPWEPETGPRRAPAVCHQGFHRLEPDMRISSRCWVAINPFTPWADLPVVSEESS